MAAAKDDVLIEVAGREVKITSPGKVFFAERGETKLDLVRYYLALEPSVMRAMGGRPTMLQRFPDGAGGASFFQKRVPKGVPPWLSTTVVSTPNGTTSEAMVVRDLAHVAWAVNMGCLGFHPWAYLADDNEHVDELRLDLDPQPGTGFDEARVVAGHLRALLEELGLTGYPKTTGSRGIHVYVRLRPEYDAFAVRRAAVACARELARRHPDAVTDAWWKEERGRRIFVDYNQNASHKTVFAAWSVRARVGGQVSCPFSWDELETIDPDALTIASVPARVAEQGDPWAGIETSAQSLGSLLALWDRDMANGLQDAPWPPVYPKMPGEPPRVAPSRAKKPVPGETSPGHGG